MTTTDCGFQLQRVANVRLRSVMRNTYIMWSYDFRTTISCVELSQNPIQQTAVSTANEHNRLWC